MHSKATPTLVRHGATRRALITGGALAMAGVAMRPSPILAEANDEVSHAAESIHQERLFKANRKRIYDALTITQQFDKIIQLSGVMQAAVMAKMQTPTQISPRVGGPFALFGGYIVGRQLQLVPEELIVQAWRVGNWARGMYSVARFELVNQGADTKLVFDHGAFPKGQAEHLASGWQEHYWDPLVKFLAAAS
jgi:activator of HSP90 ATPase